MNRIALIAITLVIIVVLTVGTRMIIVGEAELAVATQLNEDSVIVLLEGLDQDGPVREFSQDALVQLDQLSSDIFPILEKLREHEDEMTRVRAYEAMGFLVLQQMHDVGEDFVRVIEETESVFSYTPDDE